MSRPHSADSAVLNPLSRVAAALSLASIALSADESALAWDSINLDLRGDRPPTGSNQQSAMDLPESLSRQSSAASLRSGPVSPNVPSRSQIPTPVRRSNVPSRASEQAGASHADNDWSRPPQLYVTEARLAQVASELSSALELGLTRSTDAFASRFASFAQTIQERAVERVIDAVSAEYNATAIQNVERNAAFRNELATLARTVAGNSEGLGQTTRTLGQATALLDRVSLSANETAARFGQWPSLEAVISAMRSDFEASLSNLAEAIRSERQAEVQQLADSIRALSLRLGAVSTATPLHSCTGGEGQRAPSPPPSVLQLLLILREPIRPHPFTLGQQGKVCILLSLPVPLPTLNRLTDLGILQQEHLPGSRLRRHRCMGMEGVPHAIHLAIAQGPQPTR